MISLSVIVYVLGAILIVFGFLFLLFPKTLENISNAMSQVVIDVEDKVSKTRLPVGVLLLVVGCWVIWVAFKAKGRI